MDRYEVMQSVAASAKAGAGVTRVMPQAIDLCRQIESEARWDLYTEYDWRQDAQHCRNWLAELLLDDAPGSAITGFWFGIFNPMRQGRPRSDFYVTGSAHYPSVDWVFSQDWQPSGRYAHSPGQAALYRLAESEGPNIVAIVDYVLTFAHAAATVNDLIVEIDSSRLLDGAERRGIAVGHDSGDALFLGELNSGGFDRSVSDWI